MTESEWLDQLTRDGFVNVLFCDAMPNNTDEDHMHDRDHKMVIFSGDVHMTIGHLTVHLGADDYFEIPRGSIHSMIVGTDGCRYLLGERM